LKCRIHWGQTPSTVYRYGQRCQQEELADLLESGNRGYWGLLSGCQTGKLCEELKGSIYTDSKPVALWIRQAFGVEYTQQGAVDLLNRIGFTYKKTKEVPCECDVEKQQSFMKELSEVFAGMDDRTVIYYAGGVHPAHNSRSTYAWIEKGKELEQPTVSGRERVNINGPVNAKEVTDVIAIESERINAQSTRELYRLATEKHPEAEKIHIISDNARYYRNAELTERIKGTKITQLFLPPYAPNLNLIERLWRLSRKKVINTHFYRSKELFRKAILSFFEHIADYRTDLASLLTLNFRLSNSHSISF
jgi:transposase